MFCLAVPVVLLLACTLRTAAEPSNARKSEDGWLSFYQGDDVKAEFRRLNKVGWRQEQKPVRLRGEVLDDATGKPLPARVYVLGADGSWHFARSEAKAGSAVE